MTGLMLFGAVFIWLFVALRLARWLSRMIKVRDSFRPLISFGLVVLIFLLPVADELAARPYFEALCHRAAALRVDAQQIRGRKVVVQSDVTNVPQQVATLRVFHSHFIYVDPSSGMVLAEYDSYAAEGGVLARAIGLAHSHPLTGTLYCAPRDLESAGKRYGFAVLN